ncbi:hypothetical protein [Luteibacter sp.]|nr:hypothetical protein [Luteibacter sp.]
MASDPIQRDDEQGGHDEEDRRHREKDDVVHNIPDKSGQNRSGLISA